MEAKQIERLISTKASTIDLCTGKWNNGCPTGCCRSRAASWALPALFQCKRQPNVCPQLESLCESTADYVGISVVVSHKYARTQAHTHTPTQTQTHTHLHTPWSAASGRSRDSIRYTHSLYAGFGLFVCMLVYVCVCAIFYALHGNSKTPTSSRATTTTTTTTTRAKQSAAQQQQQQ